MIYLQLIGLIKSLITNKGIAKSTKMERCIEESDQNPTKIYTSTHTYRFKFKYKGEKDRVFIKEKKGLDLGEN